MSTIPSKRFSIWRRLTERFQLEATPAMPGEPPSVVPHLQPITNIDTLLTAIAVGASAYDISAGSGSTTIATVPNGKRWRLKYLSRTSSAAATTVNLDISGATLPIILAATSGSLLFPIDFLMEEGDRILATNTGNGGDTAVTFRYLAEEEDAF